MLRRNNHERFIKYLLCIVLIILVINIYFLSVIFNNDTTDSFVKVSERFRLCYKTVLCFTLFFESDNLIKIILIKATLNIKKQLNVNILMTDIFSETQ